MPFSEVDSVIIPGLNTSLGSYIGRPAKESVISESKSRYFVALGHNDILDLTDDSPGSQLAGLNETSKSIIREKLLSALCESDNGNDFSAVMGTKARKYDGYVKNMYWKKSRR